MKADTAQWLKYAAENLAAAETLAAQNLYNACLQNCQQCAEKALKAAVLEFALPFVKTHSISQLLETLRADGHPAALSEDDADLLDSIYLPSKYPVASVLPSYEPDAAVCARCLAAARAVERDLRQLVSRNA